MLQAIRWKRNCYSNGDSKPDYEGYEVKTLLNTNVTLMTPEPDSGLYKEQGLKAFLKRYGYPVKPENIGSVSDIKLE